MKISKRLKINSWIYIVAVMLMMLALAWAFWIFDKNNQNEKLVEGMKKTAFERIALRDDYLLNREERASIQWQAKSEALRGLMETAAESFTDKEDKALLQKARQYYDATFAGFSAILEKDKLERRKANRIFSFDEKNARQITQIFLNSYILMDSIGMLHESTAKAALRARSIFVFLIIFFFVFDGLVIVINSNVINRIMVKRLAALTSGVKFIGEGNLDYQIVADADDELADLARSSNKMAAKLKQSHTSVETLQKEISERRNAEEAIKKISLHQQALLKAIPDIIMEVDNNKIYTWANERGIDYFGEDVIGKEADFYFVKEQNTYDVVQPIFNGNETIIYLESWQRRKDGQERLLAWWCHVLKDAQGNVIGALSSARDVTERKLAEEEIKKLNAELEQRVAERTAELTVRTAELERINKVFVDRELRMRELKARIAELEGKGK